MDLDEVVYDRACGLDVHFCFLTACFISSGPKGRVKVEEKRFQTNQRGLRELRAWLEERGCQAVGMEATGVYWMPVYAALEGAFKVLVGNPQHMKNARGQKTDRNDARWIAGQVRHGRIRPSFIPPPEFRGARKAARARRQLINARTAIRNEVQRGLAESGITLAAFVSDVFGVSGMAILNALAVGKSIQEELPSCLKTRLKQKFAPIAAALEAPLDEVSRAILAMNLARLEDLDNKVLEMESLLFRQLAAHGDKLRLLEKIPGIARITAAIILAEIGVDMTAWPTEKHFSVWAGVAPGCKQTGGKSKRAPVRKGNPYLCSTLMECAASAIKTKTCYLKPKYFKLCSQTGSKKKALMAIAHKLALIVYHNLLENWEYREPTPKPPSERSKRKIIQTRVRDLERLGYRVSLEPMAAVS